MHRDAVMFQAFGRTVGIEAAEIYVDFVEERFPPDYVRLPDDDQTEPDRVWHVRGEAGSVLHVGAGDDTICTTVSPLLAIEMLSGDLELWVAEHAEPWVFVHAGAVAFDGRAVLVPGRSMSGKSTLTQALLAIGGHYLSDEYAVLSADGLVHPYARPLAIRTDPSQVSQRVPPEQLGATRQLEPVPVGVIAELQYDGDAGWAVEVVSQGTALLSLLTNTVPARVRPAAVMEAVDVASRSSVNVKGTRGDAREAAEQLRDLLRS